MVAAQENPTNISASIPLQTGIQQNVNAGDCGFSQEKEYSRENRNHCLEIPRFLLWIQEKAYGLLRFDAV